jgi:hypothetical protein
MKTLLEVLVLSLVVPIWGVKVVCSIQSLIGLFKNVQ